MDERPTGGEGEEPDVGRIDGAETDHEAEMGATADLEARALAQEAEEIRGLVEAGAGTPEAIRELAARLREHREREEALWRAQVKPTLVKENKGRFRGHGRTQRAERASTMSNATMLGLVLLGLVAVVVVAANTTAWLLVIPLVALIVWAWTQGRDSTG